MDESSCQEILPACLEAKALANEKKATNSVRSTKVKPSRPAVATASQQEIDIALLSTCSSLWTPQAAWKGLDMLNQSMLGTAIIILTTNNVTLRGGRFKECGACAAP